MREVVVVDYGVSNLHSVVRALRFVAGSEVAVRVSDEAAVVAAADAVVFPGQGAAGVCMRALSERTALLAAVRAAAVEKPFLGICMGLQVLLERSEENGGVTCLGVVPGVARRFSSGAVKVPHMGWNSIKQRDHALWQGVADESYFYFVHSYFADCEGPQWEVGSTEYGIAFSSAVARGSFFAIQAHPEKSGDVGLQVLRNFCQWGG